MERSATSLGLVYVSTATCTFEQNELRELVSQAATINRRDGVTGLLLYNGRNFLQLLEGDSGRVISLMARLRADPRHDGIRIMWQQRTATAACSDWGMRLIPLHRETASRKAELEAILPNRLDPKARALIVNFAELG